MIWKRIWEWCLPLDVRQERRWIGWLLLGGVVLVALWLLTLLGLMLFMVDSTARHGAGTLNGEAAFEPGGPADLGKNMLIARLWLVGLFLVAPLSLFRLWWHYGRGEGPAPPPPDLDAAQRGDAEAACRLAHEYEQKGDWISARAWLKTAAQAGHAPAMVDLAKDLREGRGGPKDLPTARAWLEKAVEAQEPRAPSLLRALEAQLKDRHTEASSNEETP